MREIVSRFFYRFVFPLPVWVVYKLLSLTWRRQIVEPKSLSECRASQRPVVLAHWHGDEIAFVSLIGIYKIATITSTSLDGDMMDRVLRMLGAETVRGSSTRGGISALKALLRLIKERRKNSSFAVDGPKGPLHKVKPGVFEVSRLLSAPIFAGGTCCDRKWTFERSWNKAYIPKPFAKIVFHWSEPLGPVTRDQDPHSEELALALENALHKSTAVAREKILPST